MLKTKKIYVILIIPTIAILVASFGCSSISYTPRAINLVDGNITVPAGSNYDIPFFVDLETMKDVKIVGTFEASGGSGNDIAIKILLNQ